MGTQGKHRCLSVNAQGHVLMASLMLIMVLSLLSMTAFFLADQDSPGVSAMREEIVARQLADAVADLAVSWFHDTPNAPQSIAGVLMNLDEFVTRE